VGTVAGVISAVTGFGSLATEDHSGIPIMDPVLLGMNLAGPTGAMARIGGKLDDLIRSATKANDGLFTSALGGDHC
jgi:hypothetical protein